ncbi:MAG: MarC family protein [Deltaproteobacteria bacterium]|nr:MarC family protein [Deltaproteobacteria bacterium]
MEFAILSFASLFIIVDPIGIIPVFLAMTPHNTAAERIKMAGLACVISLLILVAFALMGNTLLSIFGITLPAFEIAGGVILLLVGIDMLQARRTQVKETYEEQVEGTSKEDIAVTPLAVPMLAGPGAITTVILLSSQASTWVQRGILVINILIVIALTFSILSFVTLRTRHLNIIVLKIMVRVMGLILTAIAVQFILNGMVQIPFPGS